jgi:putative transposase
MQKHIAKLAKNNPYWNKMGSQSLQEICQRVDATYKQFFKKIGRGRPNFHNPYKSGSFMFKGKVGYSLNGNEITINKLGHTYRFKLTRQYGTVKNIHIKRDNRGYLWLIITTDVIPKQYERLGDASIGIDFGMKHFLTTSDGEIIDSPEVYKKSLKTLAKLNRNLSRKKKGSNSRKRCLRELSKFHEHVANQRADFQWKLAHELCKCYSHIGIEDLNLRGMKKLWGRKISDLSYGEFINKLMYVAQKYGTVVVKIGRFESSSQTCNVCGYKNQETKQLNIRTWVCPECGTEHDRDVNAAINILRISKGKGISLDRSNSKSDMSPDNQSL